MVEEKLEQRWPLQQILGWLEAWPWSPATPERRVSTPFHFQHIAHWGTCGKTRVVPQNRWPRPEPAEMGVANACVVVDV